jgi:non-specific serine/threonine protein kinase
MNSLPQALTTFIGREREVAALLELLAKQRLVTLTGAGGCGKTRLALETATRVAASGDSIAWVDLASVASDEPLSLHVARSLGLRPEGSGPAEMVLVARLRDSRCLIVLDNCEHLVDSCAELARRLLQDCHHVRILATSRESLGVPGERSWLVPSLTVPLDGVPGTLAELMASESARLFFERAREVQPHFAVSEESIEPIVRICRRLDGLPLAIELAAARTSVLTPLEIAHRLDDRFALLTSNARSAPPRHRTLRAAVDWSYELLTEPERLLLERLSVFAGGFTLEAVEEVCTGGTITESSVLDLLAGLTVRSLVTMQEQDGRSRYRLLETIREYATARRTQRGDTTDCEARHALYFLGFAQALAAGFALARPEALRRMDGDYQNILAAFAWSARHGAGTTVGLPLAWSLTWYWFHRQRWREGFALTEAALASSTDPAAQLRAAALYCLGLFGMYQGHPQTTARLVEAQSLWESTGNDRWLALTLMAQSTGAAIGGHLAEARRLAQQAHAIAARAKDDWAAALTSAHGIVPVLVTEQQWQDAADQLAAAERIFREHEYATGLAYVLDMRAFVALMTGDAEQALELAAASLQAEPDAENRWLAGRSLRIIAAVEFQRGNASDAARLFGAAEAMYEWIGAKSVTSERRSVNELLQRLRETMDPREFETSFKGGRSLGFAQAMALAMQSGTKPDRAAAASEAQTPRLYAGSAAPVPILTVQALGPLEVRLQGQPLSADAWRFARPRELLVYLLTHAAGKTRDEIGLDFWPDASAAQVKNNVHVTLHHLRRAIGHTDLVRFEAGRYRIDRSGGVEFDVEIFEAVVGMSVRSRGVGARPSAARIDELAAALNLYRGPYLSGETAGDWHCEMRDRLATDYLKGLHALGAWRIEQDRLEEATEVLQRLVSEDPTHEPGTRLLMSACAKLGRRQDALRAYERLRTALDEEFSTAPEKATRLLATRIRGED